MKYRPDIDGLRAIAVLPVLFYHADIPFISGGFLGVDVFFVISGFLITSIISKQISEGRFSLLTFYEKRARRLLPALTGVILATFIAGWFFLLPSEYRDLGHSAIAAAAFLSNVYFALTLDYFTTAAEFTPLLHTWSLAVEEQFYLFYPPLLMLLIGKGSLKFTYWTVIILSILSLIAAMIMLPIKADITFYLIFFRAWELGIGAILALSAIPAIRRPLTKDLISIVGLLAIVSPMFLYTSDTPFPGFSALPPVLGAAALIFTGAHGGGGIVNKILTWRSFVWVGLISYSLYLWHWPIFTFIRIIRSDATLPLNIAIPAIVFSVFISWLSYKLIEAPFRSHPSKGFSQKAIFGLSGVMLTAMIGGGAFLLVNNGISNRVSDKVNEIASVAQHPNRNLSGCFRKLETSEFCSLGTRPTTHNSYDFLFWGDSHAMAIESGLDTASIANKKSGIFVGSTGCLPVFEIKRHQETKECAKTKIAVLNFLNDRDDISTVVLMARWPMSVEGTRYKQEAGSPVTLTWSGLGNDNKIRADNATLVEAGLTATVEKIIKSGRKVVILGPVPEVGWNVPKAMARAEMLKWLPAPVNFPRADFEARASRTEAILKRVSSAYDAASYIGLSDLFCNDDTCTVANENGIPLYRDDDHITVDTSQKILAPRLAKIWLGE